MSPAKARPSAVPLVRKDKHRPGLICSVTLSLKEHKKQRVAYRGICISLARYLDLATKASKPAQRNSSKPTNPLDIIYIHNEFKLLPSARHKETRGTLAHRLSVVLIPPNQMACIYTPYHPSSLPGGLCQTRDRKLHLCLFSQGVEQCQLKRNFFS